MGLLGRHKTLKPKPIFTALLAVMILMSSSIAMGSDTKITATKTQLRALFIQKIPKYVLWPEQTRLTEDATQNPTKNSVNNQVKVPKENTPYTVATIDKECFHISTNRNHLSLCAGP